MNCDRLAPAYRWFEYAAFGTRLERHRFRFLSEVSDCRRALLLGDGDGRFAARLLNSNPKVNIDSVELSSGMIGQATRRISTAADPARIRFIQQDALCARLNRAYDLVVTNFMLDCLCTPDADRLITSVADTVEDRAFWIVTEFQKPEAVLPRWHANVWLTAMYGFFRIATGLRTCSLPEYHPALHKVGFTLKQAECSMAGLITSELWARL